MPSITQTKFIGQAICSFIFGLGALDAYASPNQLDLLGLVPAVSDSIQVQQAGVNPPPAGFDPSKMTDNIVFLEIGGHTLFCVVQYFQEKLDNLSCASGKRGFGNNEQVYTKASNIEVYDDLSKGLTKKFGKPDLMKSAPMQTRSGAKYVAKTISWKDKRGNVLKLESIADTVDTGYLYFYSARVSKEIAADERERVAKKKF